MPEQRSWFWMLFDPLNLEGAPGLNDLQFPSVQEGKRNLRQVTDQRQRLQSGQSTGSQRHAQIAPTPQEEQKILQLPTAINLYALQDSDGLIFFQADIDSPDDPCHPLRF